MAAARSLVYAYGCGAPICGWEHAEAEHERCTQLWDQLVELERTIERELLLRAQDDDARLREIGEEIGRLTERLAEEPGDKDARCARRLLYREQRERLKDWRKAHKDVVREFEVRRQVGVKAARQQSPAYTDSGLLTATAVPFQRALCLEPAETEPTRPIALCSAAVSTSLLRPIGGLSER